MRLRAPGVKAPDPPHRVFPLPVRHGFGYSRRLVFRRRSSVVERILGKIALIRR